MIRGLAYFLRYLNKSYWNMRARIQFGIRGLDWPVNFSVLGPLGLSAVGKIVIGKNVTIVNDSKYNRAGVCHPTQLVAAGGAQLSIGDNTGISGASIYATKSIKIGNHVLVGVNCHIYDSDFHPIHWEDRRSSINTIKSEVVIEDDVWLCANVTVLKGVTIGARSVIAAGSVVTADIPSDVLAGGIPAKAIRPLSKEKESTKRNNPETPSSELR